MNSKRRRFRLIADWKIQGRFCLRVAIYWVICQATLVATLLGFLALEGLQDVGSSVSLSPWRLILPAVVASSLFLPIVLFDSLKFSNKLAGPLFRLKKDMKRLANGGDVAALKFRTGDFLIDLSEHFNEINSRLHDLKEQDSFAERDVKTEESLSELRNDQLTPVG